MARWLLILVLLAGCTAREEIPRDLYDASIVVPTPTLEPTATIEQQPTVEPPTNTPEPTPTTAPIQEPPTRAPLPTVRAISAAEQAYTQSVQEQVSTLGVALGDIGELSSRYDGSDEWKIDMAVQMALVKFAHQTLTGLTPPSGYEAFHVLLLSATSDCNEAMDVMARGIDNNRPSDVEDAGTLMRSCGEKTVPVLQEMRRLQGT